MKIRFSLLAVFAALIIAFGSSSAYSQSDQMTGTYGDANVKAKDVIAAAKFAVKKGAAKEKATINLVSVKQARQQLVAGINYEVCLQVNYKKGARKAVKKYAKAVVYKNLKNVYSLTSWEISDEPLECKD